MLSRLGFTASCIAVLVAGAGARATPEEARQRLERAAAAVEGLKSLTYTVESFAEGDDWFASMTPRIETRIAMRRRDGEGGGWLVRASGVARVADEEPLSFLVVSDGATKQWIDESAKAVVQRAASHARGPEIDHAASSAILELTEPKPFSKQLAADQLALEGQVDVGGVPCDVVYIDFGPNQMKQRWMLATTDGLPRRVERILKGEGLDTAQIYIVKSIKLNPELPAELFTIQPPEGYEDRRTAAAAPSPPSAAAPAEETSATPAHAADRAEGTEVGNLAPDWELARPDGTKVRLSELRGRVVLLDFWGTWCIPCRPASPVIQQLHEKYKDRGLKVLGLAVRERNDEAPVEYFKDHELTYDLLLRADEVAHKYRIRSYPTFIVIGREGRIALVEAGFSQGATFERLAGAIEAELGGEPDQSSAPEQAAEQSGG